MTNEKSDYVTLPVHYIPCLEGLFKQSITLPFSVLTCVRSVKNMSYPLELVRVFGIS